MRGALLAIVVATLGGCGKASGPAPPKKSATTTSEEATDVVATSPLGRDGKPTVEVEVTSLDSAVFDGVKDAVVLNLPKVVTATPVSGAETELLAELTFDLPDAAVDPCS